VFLIPFFLKSEKWFVNRVSSKTQIREDQNNSVKPDVVSGCGLTKCICVSWGICCYVRLVLMPIKKRKFDESTKVSLCTESVAKCTGELVARPANN